MHMVWTHAAFDGFRPQFSWKQGCIIWGSDQKPFNCMNIKLVMNIAEISGNVAPHTAFENTNK